MSEKWFDSIAEVLKSRLDANPHKCMEFVVGVRVNGVPHIGTYLTLASTFLFAAQAKKRIALPASIRIHFLDNDPVKELAESIPNTHFRCVFQERSSAEAAEFLDIHYFPYLNALAALCDCPYAWETYSSTQSNPEFRSTVLKSLAQWKNFKYYVSGPPLIGLPTGVRGIGSPCPECGLFNGWVRPAIDLESDSYAVLESKCCDHGEYSTTLTPSNDPFVNLETTYRNVIKEILALKRPEVLSVMMKGLDWEEGLRNVNTVMDILGISSDQMPLRFLLPVVKTESGVKLSKSAIQRFPKDFNEVSPALLDMKIFRAEVKDYANVLISLSNRILSDLQFITQPVLPSDITLRLSG